MDYRSLSKTEAKVVLSLEAEGVETVSLADIRKRANVSSGFSRKLAYALVRKGWLQRLRRGTYLLNPSRHGPEALPDTDPFRIGSRLVEPYYFGFATAAELEGLFPQASRVYYLVTTARWKPGKDLAERFRVVRVLPARFFGTQVLSRRGMALTVSDPERTVLDCLHRPEFAGGMAGVSQIFAFAKPKLNWSRLGGYLDRFGSRSLAQRTGYIAERIRPSVRPPDSWARRFRAATDEPFIPLGPPSTYGRRGSRDLDWHVIENVPREHLFAEGEIR
jgi:predicted transcriptional regulator of viral defense system